MTGVTWFDNAAADDGQRKIATRRSLCGAVFRLLLVHGVTVKCNDFGADVRASQTESYRFQIKKNKKIKIK
jgi:hypothetical protein